MSNHKPYNSYAQYYKEEAPPQPAWAPPVPTAQPPRTGWADPRLSQQYEQQPQLVLAPGAFSYNPNQYGPMPGASPAQSQAPQYTWGAKYQQQAQQHQQHEPTPPLPPRPSSAVSRIDTPVPLYHSPTPAQWQGRPSDIQHTSLHPHTPGETWGPHNSQYNSQSNDTPPPPPPRPAAYASNWPHEHYASKPPSQQYEPATNLNWNQALAGQHHVAPKIPNPAPGYNNSGPQNQALVSPIDPIINSWTPSADTASQEPLSHTPRYNHYHTAQTPLQGDPNFTGNFPIQTASAFAGPTSDWEHFAPEPYAVSPEIAHSTPADLTPQFDMAEAISAHGARQSLAHRASEVRNKQHEQHDDGRAMARPQSFSSNGSEAGLRRTGTIDSVIHAWNGSIRPQEETLRKASLSTSRSMHSARPSIDPGQKEARFQEHHAQTEAPQDFASDPYGDLEPQFRASLARFVSMLRKEAVAESDEDKFKVFDTFLQKERRLRAVLYDIDVTPARADLGVPDRSRPPENATSNFQTTMEAAGASDKAVPVLEASEQQEPPQAVAAPAPTAVVKSEDSSKSKEDSFVMVDREQGDDAATYSPGGRPLIPRLITVKTNTTGVAEPIGNPQMSSSPGPLAQSPSDNAPEVVGEDYASTVPESPALAAPIILKPKHPEGSPRLGLAATSNGPLSMPVKFEPTRPVYTPFRYAEGHVAQSDNLDVQHPLDQDYLSKRNTYDASRLMHDVPSSLLSAANLASPTSTKKIQEETFLGLIRSHSTVRPKQKFMSFPESIRPGTTPPSVQIRSDPIEDAVKGLRYSLPPALPEKLHTDKALHIRQRMDVFVDDFAFIRETVVPWDRDNREIRKKLDEERHKRQEESEIRLDELFNDNEIAYAELKGMEADFKLAEAERRYEEDKQELESFSKGVFEVVAARLQQQVDALNKEYVLAIDLLDLESDSAGRMLTGSGGRSAMSEAMDIVLQLFQKLNIRYHKLAEARFERERRRKRLELTVLYTNGDSEGTKSLEKDFTTAEKLQVLHEARNKDRRANQLMESFERATVRGLGDNQAFLDELSVKVRKLNDVLPVHGAWRQSATDSVYGQNGARNALTSARGFVDFVLADSRALLMTSNAADKALNDADYAVSMAEANAANADEVTNRKLEADFVKEEEKLIEKMSMRMDSITKTPVDCANLIQEIISRIGDDGEHADRMQKALEQAKMRNTRKQT